MRRSKILSKERVDFLLQEIRRVANDYRLAPAGYVEDFCGGHRHCFNGAYPRDLGATKRDQRITRELEILESMGRIKRLEKSGYYSAPAYVIVEK